MPSSLPDTVERNRRALADALIKGPFKPVRYNPDSRTIRLPVLGPGQAPATFDSVIDVGQIALLYTLSSHRPPRGAAPDPPTPVPSRRSPHNCWVCGNIGVRHTACRFHPVCYTHRQDTNADATQCQHCTRAPPTCGIHPLRNLVYRLLVMTLGTPHHYQAPSVRQACRLVLRTHSDLHLNPLTARAPWGAVWRTTDTACSLLGGTYQPSPTEFMADRHTWVCLTDPIRALHCLRQAVMSISASTQPARVALLAHDTPELRAEIGLVGLPARACIIAHAPPSTITLQDSSHCLAQAVDTTNDLPLLLVLIENKSAPGFKPQILAEALTKANLTPNCDPWPWACSPPPPDAWEGPIPTLAPRHHPLLRPSQSWFRTDLDPVASWAAQLDPPGPNPKLSPTDQIHPCLAVLGTTPTGLRQALSQYHENDHIPNPKTKEKISKLIYSTSLALFRKHESFRKWKRKFS